MDERTVVLRGVGHSNPFGSRLGRKYAPLLLIFPALAVLFVLLITPYGYMSYVSFMTPSTNSILINRFTTGNYASLLKNTFDMQTFGRTFTLAAVVTIIKILLAYRVASNLS